MDNKKLNLDMKVTPSYLLSQLFVTHLGVVLLFMRERYVSFMKDTYASYTCDQFGCSGCIDQISNCDEYGPRACTGAYVAWAQENCCGYCRNPGQFFFFLQSV